MSPMKYESYVHHNGGAHAAHRMQASNWARGSLVKGNKQIHRLPSVLLCFGLVLTHTSGLHLSKAALKQRLNLRTILLTSPR